MFFNKETDKTNDNKQDDNKQDDNKQDDNKQDDNKQDDNKQDDNKQDDKKEIKVIKKKRGRKPKIKVEPDVPKIKKKRGRKPKKKENTVKVLKKRGRKPKNKIIKYNDNMEIKSIDCICDNIVTNLPINIDDLNEETVDENNIFINNIDLDIKRDITNLFSINDTSDIDNDSNNDKCKYNECKCNEYKLQIEELLEQIKLSNDKDIIIKKRDVYLMNTDFINMEDNIYKLNDKTDISCWWCCHQFDNPPCVLPEKIHDGKYYVFGCFCTYNCALAYNLDLNDYKTSERTTLLNHLYNKLYNKRIKLDAALPRKCLKMFGGPLTIKKFRKHLTNNIKEFRFIMPPMISIIPLIEEDYKNRTINITNKFIPLNMNKMNKMNINNTKYKSNIKSSLEKTMGLIRKKN